MCSREDWPPPLMPPKQTALLGSVATNKMFSQQLEFYSTMAIMPNHRKREKIFPSTKVLNNYEDLELSETLQLLDSSSTIKKRCDNVNYTSKSGSLYNKKNIKKENFRKNKSLMENEKKLGEKQEKYKNLRSKTMSFSVTQKMATVLNNNKIKEEGASKDATVLERSHQVYFSTASEVIQERIIPENWVYCFKHQQINNKFIRQQPIEDSRPITQKRSR